MFSSLKEEDIIAALPQPSSGVTATRVWLQRLSSGLSPHLDVCDLIDDPSVRLGVQLGILLAVR